MGSHHRGSPSEVAALDAYIKLMRAAESVTQRAHRVFPEGLTVTQFGVLETLHHLGPLCSSQLAGKLLKTAGNLTLVIDNLEKQGLVRRERDPSDRRFVTITLTPKGSTFITALFPKVAAALTREIGVLNPSEQATLARLCKRVGLGPTP
jgi:MarR family transcriptional regulator, 2-MHQ and catechol-resistance regulon repressor